MISSYSPGKLFIAGEYAVVEKGHSSILIAVDQFIEVTLKEAKHRGSIQSYDNAPIPFVRQDEKIVLDYRDNNLSYVISAINVVENLALTLNKELLFYNLAINSQLENDDGKKYGLGSSAAVTVSTIKVLCKLYNIEVSKDMLFKLAAIVHLRINSNGSGGDIAASVYTGWISYKAYDKEWLAREHNKLSVYELVNMRWPYLDIQHLEAPSNLKLMIGWTESPASTTLLVDDMNEKRLDNIDYYNEFLQASNLCVDAMIQAFKDSDLQAIQKYIIENRKLLVDMSAKLGINIETKRLEKLCDLAIKHKGAAKSSGAGGGDCGIAIFDKDDNTEQLVSDWQANKISHLNIKVYHGDKNDGE